MQPKSGPFAIVIGHRPLIRLALDDLGVIDVIDCLCSKHKQSNVSDAECVTTMALNILPGGVAMGECLLRTDVELLIGEEFEAGYFNDTRLGEALDQLDEVGSDKIMGADRPLPGP